MRMLLTAAVWADLDSIGVWGISEVQANSKYPFQSRQQINMNPNAFNALTF